MRSLAMDSVLDGICAQTATFVREAGFTDVLIGLSGGLDSSVVAALACKALGHEHVHGILMPSPYTSADSVRDASELARGLGISAPAFPITETFATFADDYETFLDEPLSGLAAENTQARLRMCILMALSNAKGWMVLNTGNRSEAAMGYSTLYGDTAGAFAPIGGLYKTEVFALAAHLNEQACRAGAQPPIPHNVLVKPPSAELSFGQTDEASLGISYDELLFQMIDKGRSPESISPEAQRVWERYEKNAFKRALEPPFAKINP
jgi:NAD+ synthase (glutamine-hydrolysing)